MILSLTGIRILIGISRISAIINLKMKGRRRMRLLICAGGTGVAYISLGVIESDKPREILWVGTDEGMERGLVRHASIVRSIQAAGVHG